MTSSYDKRRIGKPDLKGKTEIESFFNIVMMVSDGLQHEIEFMNEPINDHEQIHDAFNSTTSSSVVSALATFYTYKGG